MESKKEIKHFSRNPNVNILYYVDINHKDYHQAVTILDKYDVGYVPVRMHERMVNEDFIETLLSWSQNGFDDIVRKTFFNYLFPSLDYNELKYSEMVKCIVENYVDLLKPFIFIGSDGTMITQAKENDFKKYIQKGDKK